MTTAPTIWDQQYAAGQGLRWWPSEDLIRFLGTRYAAVPPPDRRSVHILEVGCGTGANLWGLTVEGFDAVGIEPSAPARKRAIVYLEAREVRGHLPVPVLYGTAGALPWDDGTFDGLVDVQTLQHVVAREERRRAFAEVARVLRPGGWLFTVHALDGSDAVPGVAPPLYPGVDFAWRTHAELTAEVEAAGLTVTERRAVSREWLDADGATRQWITYAVLTAER